MKQVKYYKVNKFSTIKPGEVDNIVITTAAFTFAERIEKGGDIAAMEREFRDHMDTMRGDYNANVDHISRCFWQTVSVLLAEKLQAKNKQD